MIDFVRCRNGSVRTDSIRAIQIKQGPNTFKYEILLDLGQRMMRYSTHNLYEDATLAHNLLLKQIGWDNEVG